MTLIGFQVLACVSFGTKMDLTLLSTNDEKRSIEHVEVEAHTTCKSIKEGLFLVFSKTLVFIDYKSELDDFLSFKFVLHKTPVGDSTVTRDRVEVQILDGFILVPPNLPYWVSMLVSSNRGHIDWLVVTLDSNIIDHNSTVIKTDSQKCGMLWVEIKAHDTRLGGIGVLWPRWVLDGVAADQACVLLQEVIRSIAYNK